MRNRLLFVLLAMSTLPAAFAADLHVPGDYETIQEAVNASASGDTIILADGTYTGPGNRDVDVSFKHITIRSENGAENCIIDLEGSSSRAFYLQVDDQAGDRIPNVFDGITIQNSNSPQGGGIYLARVGRASNLILIQNCVFRSNGKEVSFLEGGALYGEGGFPTLVTNCLFEDNGPDGADTVHTANGGAINSFGSFINCVFRGNGAGAAGQGGAAYVSGGFYNCLFEDNEAGTGGAGCFSDTFTNCIFKNNNAYIEASTLFHNAPSDINHCLFLDNGNRIASYCLSTLAQDGRGGVRAPQIRNSIFWGNGPENVRDLGDIAFTLSYCDIEGGYAGIGNISAYPLFVNAAGGDFHLAEGSPCIDAADPSNNYPTDFDNVPRPQGAHSDIGPYERPLVVVTNADPVAIITGAPSKTIECTGSLTQVDLSGDSSFDPDEGDVVSYAWSCEALGVSGGDATFTFDAPKGDYVVELTVADQHGASSSTSIVVHVVDSTPPVIELIGGPVNDVPCGGSFVDPGATAIDICDGDISSAIQVIGSVDTMHPGVYTLTYSVSDESGNAAVSVQRTVRVVYSWTGFLQPINQNNSSIFKKGSTIPVKFALTGACSSVTDGQFRLYYAQVSGSIVGTELEAASTSAADSGNLFRYSGGQYIFNLSTSNFAVGTWRLRVDLGDGVLRTVLISIK